jgi:tyrosine-protein kinase Etk/Wzc
VATLVATPAGDARGVITAERPGKPDHRFVIWMLCVFVGFPNLKLANVQFVEAFMLFHMLYLLLSVALRGGPEQRPQGLWIKPGIGYGIAMFLVLAFGFLSYRLPVYPPMYGPFFIHMRMLPVVARWIELTLVVFYALYAAELMRRDARLRDYGMKAYMWSGVVSGWLTFLGYFIYGFLKVSVTTNGAEHRGQGGFPEGGPWGMYLLTVAIVARMLWVRGKLTKTQGLVITLTLAGSFLSAKSKSAVICALVMLLINIFLSNNVRQKVVSLVGLGLVAGASWFVFDVPTLWHIATKLQQSAELIVRINPVDPNLAYGRVAGSVVVPRMIKAHPITGIGFGNYPVMRNDPVYLGIMLPDRYYDLPGVGLLAVAGELGLPVLTLLYGLMLYTVWRARRTRAHRLVFTLALCQPLVHIFGAQITLLYPWLASGIALSLMPVGYVPRLGKHQRWLPWMVPASAGRDGRRVGDLRRPRLRWQDAVFNQVIVVARQKRLVLGVTLGCVMAAVIYSLVIPKMYQSEVVILPSQEKPTLGMGGSAADLTSALASTRGINFKTSEDFWAAVMRGPTLGDMVVKDQNLQAVYKKKDTNAAREELESRTTFNVDRAGLIGVRVKDPDPERAAAIATSYVNSLHQMMANMAVDDAARRKFFLKQEVEKAQEGLSRADYALKATEQKTGVIMLGQQAATEVEQVESLKGRMMAGRIGLQSLQTTATEENPEVERLRSEMAADQAELEKLETRENPKPAVGDIGPAAVPEATREFIKAAREVRYHEELYEVLLAQLQGAERDEARAAPMLQVIDPAIPADHPSGPRRRVLITVAAILGFLLGVMAAMLRHAWRTRKDSPEGRWQMEAIRGALRGGE